MRVMSLTAIFTTVAAASFLLLPPKALALKKRIEGPGYKEGEIIVKFKQGAAEALEGQLSKNKATEMMQMSISLDELNRRHKVEKIRPLIKGFRTKRQWMKELLKKDEANLTNREKRILKRSNRVSKRAKKYELDRIYKIELAEGQSAEEALEEYRQNPDVEYAELNYIVHGVVSPNDPYYNLQWALNNTGQDYPVSGGGTDFGAIDIDIDAPEAWDIYTGDSDIVVAVIDSGVDYTHRDIAGNMWTDANGNFGIDYVNNDDDPMDDFGHGTHCAGIIASLGNNGTDITGVCWDAKIMAVKFINASNQGYISDAVNAIYYAVDNGADILSNSWGGSFYSQSLEQAVNYAYSQGAIVIASAGNANSSSPTYPAYYDHVISVAAIDSNNQKASFSSYGEWVDLAAPGVDILSLRAKDTDMYLGKVGYVPEDRFVPYGDANATMYIASGTSMACPQVAGTCALMLSISPFLGIEEIEDILVNTVEPIADGICYSDGRLNLFGALVEVIHSASKGHISLDSDYYSCDSNIGILLSDIDLIGEGLCSINMTTTSGDSETVILTEEYPPIGVFRGMIQITAGEPNIEDGNLQVTNEDIIYATYYDANDGTENPAIASDTSTIDCAAAVISNVQANVMASKVVITFSSDEPASAEVSCGLVCGGPNGLEGGHSDLRTEHTIVLSPLLQFTTYYFSITTVDTAGNQAVDTNSGGCCSFTTTGASDDIYVPSQYPTIQDGINHAWPGSVVWVADGIYTGDGNRDIDFTGKALTLKSENGPENCIIDCEGNMDEPHRGFYFKNNEDINSVLDGFTITNGFGPSDYWDGFYYTAAGGGIFCYYSSPTIKDCIITNNRTSNSPESASGIGGGICFESSSPIIVNCKITDNTSGNAPGGGIFGQDANAFIINCEISGNSSGHGCGICIEQGSPVIDGCIISNNTSSVGAHGSLYFGWGTSPTITNCLITGNTAYPGGICCWSGGDNAIINNCTIVGNTPVELGGAIYWNGGTSTVTNCIFRDNHESGLTGGVREIYENLTVSYTNIQDNGTPADGNYIAGEGNIDSDPCFVTGPSGDYYLSQISTGQASDSPCVDAGSDTSVNLGLNIFTTRIDSYLDKGIVDMGYHYALERSADIDNNWYVDLSDYASLAFDWLECSDPCVPGCAVGPLGGDIIIDDYVNEYDLAFLADSWLDCLVGTAITPNPAEGAVTIDPNVILSWTGGKGALEHDVYLGTDVNAVAGADYYSQEYVGTVSDVNYGPYSLDSDTIYFWRIDEAGSKCINKGDIWSFKTWVEPNLISWWEFDEGSGNVAYDSTGKNDGSVYEANWTSGRIGGAVDFDGIDDYISVSDDDSLDISGEITISAWVKLNDNVSNQTVVGKVSNGGGYYGGGYDLVFSSGTGYSDATFRLVFKKADGTAGTASGNYGTNTNWDRVVSTKNNWKMDIWYHIAGTWDGTTNPESMRIYINGVPNATYTANQEEMLTNIHSLQIGRTLYTSPLNHFNGVIDDVRIYDRSLSAEEIEQLYENGL